MFDGFSVLPMVSTRCLIVYGLILEQPNVGTWLMVYTPFFQYVLNCFDGLMPLYTPFSLVHHQSSASFHPLLCLKIGYST